MSGSVRNASQHTVLPPAGTYQASLFPERKRCRTCHKALGATTSDPVYFGSYCSHGCAGIACPATVAEQAPRECRTQRDNQRQWHFKRRYRSESEIPERLKATPQVSWYWCQHCGHLHIGHSRIKEEEKLRVVTSREALSDLLVKSRGLATRKEVAAVAGIRPIRLKELEEGAATVDLNALFAVLRVYRLKLAVSFSS